MDELKAQLDILMARVESLDRVVRAQQEIIDILTDSVKKHQRMCESLQKKTDGPVN